MVRTKIEYGCFILNGRIIDRFPYRLSVPPVDTKKNIDHTIHLSLDTEERIFAV